MATKKKTVEITTMNAWVTEAAFAQQDTRAEQWTDEEFRDGTQWTQSALDNAADTGLNPMTANRIFPVVNMLQGLQAVNPLMTTAKGRTGKDTEAAEVLTEGIQFVSDQCEGQFLISEAFKDELIPGIGWIYVGHASDPRQEKVRWFRRDWKEMWYDPYSSPWVTPDSCRYMFFQRWMDMDDLVGMFPEKEEEIRYTAGNIAGSTRYGGVVYDEAQRVEDLRRTLTGVGNYDAIRNRVRPVEMWYTVYADCLFATFADGRVIEVSDNMPVMEQFSIVRAAQTLVKASVKKMRVCTFLGDTILQDTPTPFPHDEYPFIPFIGYIDRYGNPYGVVRNLRGMQIEVNERRTMALALLSKKQVIAETTVVDKPEKLQALYEEGQKPDGMLIVQPGQSGKIQLVEHGQLSAAQMQLMNQSEQEISQISGSMGEMQFGSASQMARMSGNAAREHKESSTIINASLFTNMRRSLKRLGEQTTCLMQGEWTKEKVLRITDRMSGAERFVALNERIPGPNGGYEIRNDITKSKVDVIVSDAPLNDSAREKNMDMIIEWVKKSPPEIIPHLINVAFELSSIPNKELLLSKMRPILGIDPRDEELSQEQLKQKTIEKLQAQAQEAQMINQMKQKAMMLDLENKQLLNDQLKAEITHLQTKPVTDRMKANTAAEKVQIAAIKTGADIELKKTKQQLEKEQKVYDNYMTAREHQAGRDDAVFDKAMALREQDHNETMAQKKEEKPKAQEKE